CKSTLNLIGECHSLSYDALTAHVAIVFARYMLLALEQRKNEDQRTLGELFFFLVYFVKCFSQKSERKIPNLRNRIFPYISRKHFHMIVVQSVA
ncbi:MAG: hypothetical protein MR998_00545, partial [Lachnospiraceae bacterium]|nr:hypothetical protein [Lachnospiraceae bacterium]